MVTPEDALAFIRSLINQRKLPMPVEGLVVPGSWDPKKGTAHILVGTTGALDASEIDDQPVIHRDVPLLTNHIGDQGGPIGNERAVLFPIEEGHTYVAMLFHDALDSPGALAGEKHLHLRARDVQLALACYLKIQQDATRLGHQQKVAVLSPVINLGMESSSSGQGIVNEDLAQQLSDLITQHVQTAFDNLCKIVQPGSGVPPPKVEKSTAKGSTVAFADAGSDSSST